MFPTGHKQGGLNYSIDDYVFAWNQPLTGWAIRTTVARRAEEAGLGVVAPHDLRRLAFRPSAGYALLRCSVDGRWRPPRCWHMVYHSPEATRSGA